MAEAVQNDQTNVSVGKGVKGGYAFVAPLGTPLPTDLKTRRDPAFKVLGFVSEDGYVETVDEDSDDIVDMNGDLIGSSGGSRVESAQFTPAEIKAGALRTMYGADNVTDADGVITVRHNGDSHPVFSYLFEFVLRDGRRWRKVVPCGQSSELDDLTISSSELCARALTVKYLTDSAGNTCYDYIESTETDGAAKPVPVDSVALDKAVLTVAAGADAVLTASIKPDDATDKEVSASSSDTGKATVKASGASVTVHGVDATAAGSTVRVTVSCGGKSAACDVTVTAPAGK